MIFCHRVTKKLDGRTILADVTMEIGPAECVCVTGEARSGKTTLFRLLAKDDEPTSGRIEIDGVPLGKLPPLILQLYRGKLGLIFQDPLLLAHATVAENIAFPLELRGTPSVTVRRRTEELLRRLRIAPLASALPATLSQSERSLVGIARAFAGAPLILLADEPISGLDESQADTVLGLLREAREQGCTIVAFTSNPSLADLLGARMLTLASGVLREQQREKAHATPLGNHRILEAEETPVALADAAPKKPATRRRPAKEKKSVKITAINS